MMYSDFIATAPSGNATSNSTRLQALHVVLEANVMDGCSLIKKKSAVSNEVNFTTESPDDVQCSQEELATFRTYCVEQSLIQLIIEEPFGSLFGNIQASVVGSCDWISGHFQEPERSIILDSTPSFNCNNA